MNRISHFLYIGLIAFFASGIPISSPAQSPCRIEVIDQDNGWPVPLVQFETTHHLRFVSDNAGVIALDSPELMAREVWFDIQGHGYGVDPDGFGYSGVRLTPQPGETLTVKVKRRLPAKRLGRLTGAGLFAESQKLGQHMDWKEQNIMGCDSVQNTMLVQNGSEDKLFWLWGDTTLANYPLGRFHTTGATTTQQPIPNLEPPIGLQFDYFTDPQGVPRNIAEMPGDGPTWLFGLVSLPDRDGKVRMGATYSKIKAPLTEYEKGLCVWNEKTSRFDRFKVVWERSESNLTAPMAPHGHAIPHTDADGKQWILFGDPFPNVRCAATWEDWSTPSKWETFEPASKVAVRASNETIEAHRGAVVWNEYKNQWITVFTQKYGDSSLLGEIWYAESDSPLGPWNNAVKIVTHDQYTFYNPQVHVEMVPSGSPVLLFEATYTAAFSKAKVKTPRYDYNQILYRLDLNEPPFSND